MTENTSVSFNFRNIPLLLSETGAGVWRLQSKGKNGFDNMGAAQTLAADLHENREFPALPVEISGDTVTGSDGSKVVISEKEIRFYDCGGKLRRTVSGISEGNGTTEIKLVLTEKEKIYGTGERFDSVGRRGKKVHIYAIDKWCRTRGNSYNPVPLLISSDGSGIFLNRFEHSVFDIGRTERSVIKLTQKYAPLDMYIFMAEKPGDVIAGYCRLTGFAPMPPEWAFGTLVCRYHPEFQHKEGVFAMMDAMEENGFPWEAVILEGYRPYDKNNWPELREISDRVHAGGKHLMLYNQCGRFPGESEKNFGLTDEYAVRNGSGTYLHETRSMNLLDNFSRKDMRCYDLTDEKARAKCDEIWREFADMGVEGAKIDFCEQFPDSPDTIFADGRDPMAAHHWYPVLFNTLRYNRFAESPDGGLTFSRGGGIGAQRYPFIWAGDQRREFYFLKAVIKAALSCGLSGIPFVSWDMAGYQPAWNLYDRKHEAEVFTRALEFTAFSPCIQTHGRVTRPYDFDEKTKKIYYSFSHIHECLRPYLLEQAEISVKTGLPLMRHLCLYDSKDEKCLETEDEYMLGGSLLVCPILKRKNKRNIYLPAGSWINIFTGEKFSGNRMLKNYSVPLDEIPVFRQEKTESAVLDACLAESEKYFI